jgi:hypothetical protein
VIGNRRCARAIQYGFAQFRSVPAEAVDVADHRHAVEYGHSEQRDETDRRRKAEVQPAQPYRRDSADQGELFLFISTVLVIAAFLAEFKMGIDGPVTLPAMVLASGGTLLHAFIAFSDRTEPGDRL